MTKVKICGLSDAATLQAALDAGADFIGLNFFPPSPRYVSLEKAAALCAQARGKAKVVALVVDGDDALLSSIARTVGPDYFQLHGSETVQRVSEIVVLTKTPAIKVIKVRDAADVATAKSFASVAAFILFDPKAVDAALPGGNGVGFDWALLKDAPPGFMLAGGLNPGNVGRAITVTQAPMVDVASGVESAPGVKDAVLIRSFIAAAKSAR